MSFATLAAIKKANAEAGYHFFDADTMEFFDSRVHRQVYGGRYFITSEQFHGSGGYSAPRKWTIRRAFSNGDIETASSFQHGFASFADARGAVQRFLECERSDGGHIWEDNGRVESICDRCGARTLYPTRPD